MSEKRFILPYNKIDWEASYICATEEEKIFPSVLKRIIFINGRKPSREEIIKQLMTQKPVISDEEAFLNYLIRKLGR